MEQLTDLKAILHSKRANIYYLEKCRVMQKDGRVLYLTEANSQRNAENQYWNIPIANTTCLLLGICILAGYRTRLKLANLISLVFPRKPQSPGFK
jgi:CRISPR-associated endonuclease Cas1 subtype I-F